MQVGKSEEIEYLGYKSIVLFVDNNTVFLQDRKGHRYPEIGLFGGGLEAGETPIIAAIREVKEELNLNLKSTDLHIFSIKDYCILNNIYKVFFFICYKNLLEVENIVVSEGAGILPFTIQEAVESVTLPEDKENILTFSHLYSSLEVLYY